MDGKTALLLFTPYCRGSIKFSWDPNSLVFVLDNDDEYKREEKMEGGTITDVGDDDEKEEKYCCCCC